MGSAASWVIVLAIMGTAPLRCQDDVHEIRFSVTVATRARTVPQGAVIVLFVEMRNSSTFPVVVSAGYRDPPIELHLWNVHGEDVVRVRNGEIADGSAFKLAPARRLIAATFASGEKVRFRIYIPLHVEIGEYRIGARTAIQPDVSQSHTAVVVDSNRVPIVVANRSR